MSGIWNNPKSKVSKQAKVAASKLADDNCDECFGEGHFDAWSGNNANPEIFRCSCLKFTSNAQERRFNATFKFDGTLTK